VRPSSAPAWRRSAGRHLKEKVLGDMAGESRAGGGVSTGSCVHVYIMIYLDILSYTKFHLQFTICH
jgi:hypothetical protein